MSKFWLNLPYLAALICGVLYGIVCQVMFRLDALRNLYGVMSFGMVFIVPFVLGFLTILSATPHQRKSWLFRIFAPLGSIFILLLISTLVGWEGAICVVMAAVVSAPLASLGGIVAGVVLARRDDSRLQTSWIVIILALPLVSAYVEQLFELPLQERRVETEIAIAAPAATVWQNIIRVPLITEPLDGFFYKMGFPKPLEATLSYEGVGAIRNASFERGLKFIETVTTWEPERKLSFSIATHPESIPSTTLDEHVVVGGRYFDVLNGTYEITAVSPTNSILHLSSEVRISTRFNFYAGLWARFLMSDIQNTILVVIKGRSEAL